MRQPPVSLYRSARNPRPSASITIKQLAANIRGDFWAAELAELRRLLVEEGKDAYDARKISLPGITPAGQFSHRRAADLTQHSGLVPIDFDGLEPAEAIAARDLAGTSPHCVLAFVSPSERGIKALVRVQLDSGAEIDSETHHAAWVRASKHLAELVGHPADPSGKDVSRLCFVSHDPDAIYQPGAEPMTIKPAAVRKHGMRACVSRAARRAKTQRPTGTERVRNPIHYAEGALDDAARNVGQAPKGRRHDELLTAAVAIGGLIRPTVDRSPMDLLGWDEVHRALVDAAIVAGLPRSESASTAAAGMRYGMERARAISVSAGSLCAAETPENRKMSNYRITRPLEVNEETFGRGGLIQRKDSRVKDFLPRYRRLLAGLGLSQTRSCARILMMHRTGTQLVRFQRIYCGDASCQSCGAYKRAQYAAHLIELFESGPLYITEQKEEDWDSRRMPWYSVWHWALTGETGREILSTTPIDATSREIPQGLGREIEILEHLDRLRLRPTFGQRRFGASLGAGLNSGKCKKKDSKSDIWRAAGFLRGGDTMEDIVAIVKSRGGEIKDTRRDAKYASCHSPQQIPISWAEVDLGPINIDALEVLLQVEPSIHAAAAA